MNYPSNSKTVPKAPREAKRIEKVTSGEAVRRRKSLGRQFTSTFLGGDLRTAIQYGIFSVLVPAAKDALVDTFTQGLEKLVFGESKSKRRAGSIIGEAGRVAYNRMSDTTPAGASTRGMSRRARATHDFDELVLDSRPEAEAVLDRMYEILNRFESVTVADLYELVGLATTHVDNNWGWKDLTGADVTRLRGDAGYLLDLPYPIDLPS